MDDNNVGVRELKSHLSEYLRRVKAGETIIITEWGKPIGRLVPEGAAVAVSLEERMQRLIDAGLAEWNGRKPEPVKRVSLNRDDLSMTDIISEMRE
jgi:prevent-host-death family protein